MHLCCRIFGISGELVGHQSCKVRLHLAWTSHKFRQTATPQIASFYASFEPPSGFRRQNACVRWFCVVHAFLLNFPPRIRRTGENRYRIAVRLRQCVCVCVCSLSLLSSLFCVSYHDGNRSSPAAHPSNQTQRPTVNTSQCDPRTARQMQPPPLVRPRIDSIS